MGLYLPHKDLRTLLLLPHSLSKIASQLLFRRIRLLFGTAQYLDGPSPDAKAIDDWHVQRNVDIISHLMSDPTYAGFVQNLEIVAPTENKSYFSEFQLGLRETHYVSDFH